MKTYSKAEETLLSSSIRRSDVEHGFRWKDLQNFLPKLFAVWFVSAGPLCQRGLDTEEQTLSMTKAPVKKAILFRRRVQELNPRGVSP